MTYKSVTIRDFNVFVYISVICELGISGKHFSVLLQSPLKVLELLGQFFCFCYCEEIWV